MEITSSIGRTEIASMSSSKRWKDRETGPERTKIWTELKSKTERKVPVVYYLSKDGQLEHPHFMEVPLSSSEGLYLRDVINRLNLLRGIGMASLYSWSSKRSYKNGFVWQDLSENDFIYPAHGQEYVLKGFELLEGWPGFRSHETVSSSFEKQPETCKSGYDCDFPVFVRRRNESWSSIDLNEYKVYKPELTDEFTGKASDASTQTDDKRRRRRTIREEEEEEDEDHQETITPVEEEFRNHTTELCREEISPPPSNSSPETLETLMKADRPVIITHTGGDDDVSDLRDLKANNHPSGRIKASAVLMQLISCGSFSTKDSGPTTSVKDQGFSLISQYRSRLLPRGASNQETKEVESVMMMEKENHSFAGIRLEDKGYFSGSLIETKKDEFPALKRSSSYNADRSSKLELAEEKKDGVRAKCMPRKPKAPRKTKKEGNNVVSVSVK